MARPPKQQPLNKYQRRVASTTIDVYDVLAAFKVTNPGLQHAIKKLLMPGARGEKDFETDCLEAIQAIQRALLIQENESEEV